MNRIIVGLLILLVLLAGCEPASAEPISLTLIAFATGTTYAAAAAAYAGTFLLAATTFIVTSVLGLGLSYLSALLMKKPGAGVGGTTGKLQIGGVVPRSFPLGDKTVVTHSLAYANTYGADGKTPNAYLKTVMPLADMPVPGGLAEVWVNGSKVTWNPAAPSGTEGIAIPEFNKGGRDHLWIKFYDGSQATPDSRLVSLFSSDPDRPYDPGRIGKGIAYVVATARFNRDVFGGMPSYKFVLSGIPLYDVRKDSTAGGSGSHRWADPSTWEPSSNPMVQIYCIIRGLPYAGEWFFGGQTVAAQQLPVAEWSAAMNECDVLIPLAGGGSEKQYRANGEIRLDMEPADVIKDLLTACNGRLAEIGGVYKPWVGAAGVAVYSITDDDILSTAAQTFVPFKSLAEQVNGATGKYVEPAEGWTAKDASPFSVPDLEAEDGGRRQTVDVGYSYVTSGTQVQRLMRAAVQEARRERSHQIPLAPDAYPLEPNDFISWTSARNGYTNKLFRVDAAQDLASLNVGLSIVEVDLADYDWDETTDEQPVIIAPTPRVDVPSQPITDFAATAVTIEAVLGASKPAIKLSWNGTDLDDVIGVEWQVWNSAFTVLVAQGTTGPSTVEVGEAIIDAGVVGSTAYRVRARLVPGSGRPTDWSSLLAVTTPDVRVTWTALDTANQTSQTLISEQLEAARVEVERIAAVLANLDAERQNDSETVTRKVVAVSGQAKAQLLETYTVLAAADSAEAALRAALSAQVNHATTGLPATLARLITEEGTRASADSANADATTAISAQVNDSGTGLPKTRADFLSFASTQTTINGATATNISSLTASFNAISANASVSMVAVGAGAGYTAFIEMRVTAAGVNSALRLTATSGGEAGVDIIGKWFRLIKPDGVTVSAYFDTVQSTFVLDSIIVKDATITGRIKADAGVRTDSKFRFGASRYYGDNRTRAIFRTWNNGSARSASVQLQFTNENTLELWIHNVSGDRPAAVYPISTETMWPEGLDYIEAIQGTGNNYLRLWPDGQVEIGDYTGSTWGFYVAKSAAFKPWEMDPFNTLGTTKFFVDMPATLCVPAGKTVMKVKAWGAGAWGGDGASGNQAKGGCGGYGYFELAVTPGELIRVMVPLDGYYLGSLFGRPNANYVAGVTTASIQSNGQPNSAMTGFGSFGIGRFSGGSRQRWEQATPGGGAVVISRGAPRLGDGSILAVIPGGASGVGPYHGYPGGYSGKSGGNTGSMFGKRGTFDASSIWSGAGGGYEGGGYDTNSGATTNASNVYLGRAGTFYFSPLCSSVTQLVGTLGNVTPPNASDSDYVAQGYGYGEGGFSNISGTIPPGKQGFAVVEFA